MKLTTKLGVAVVASAFSFSASALTISSEFGIPVTQSTTEINETGMLDLFDNALGTLTGAVLEIFGASTQGFSATNNAAQAQTANITSSVDLLFSSSLAMDPLAGAALSFSNSTGFQSYAAGETINYGLFMDEGDASFDLAASLASLIGAGTFDVNCESFSGLAVQGGGGNLTIPQETQAGCGARISYTYEEDSVPTPSPGSLALVGLGLLAARRARKAKA